MKKNTALRLATLLCLLASALVALQSCRKEVDYSHGNEIPSNFKQSIKSDDLQAYINANRAMELFSLDWQKAQQTTIGNKNVVRVPILNVDKTAQVFKSMGLVLNRSGSIQTDRTNGNTSLTVGNNTNYDAKHPPELFFIQQIGKSSLAAFLLNFVPDAKNEGNGENGIWTGKLVEWNLTGDTILVQEINKSKLSDIYALSKNLPPENAKAKQKQISHSNKQSGFWRDLWDIFSEFIGWVGSLFGMSERYYDPYDYGWEWRLTPNFDWLTGGGGGGGGDGYTGAGYPIYDDYLPGYRPADVFPYEYPGNDPYTPYPGGPNFVTPVYSTSVTYLINNLGLTQEQIAFLTDRDDIAQAIESYLLANGLSLDNKDFAKWAVGYLKENPNEDVSVLISAGISIYYTDAEMEAIVNSMTDPITGNGVELYLILKHKGSKLFELSRYSKAINSIEAGDYTLTPHYDRTGKLVFYTGSRLSSSKARNGIEYIVKPDQLNNFRSNVGYYTEAASLVYMNGIPSKGMIQIMAGDRVSGLLNMWGDALKTPEYWAYLISSFLLNPSHPNVRSAIDDAIPTGAPYTKSTLELGRRMHAEYKLADQVPNLAIKEYRDISGIRPDFVDFRTRTIFELKPNNPRQITQGNAQLAKYKKAFEAKYPGTTWKTVLDLY